MGSPAFFASDAAVARRGPTKIPTNYPAYLRAAESGKRLSWGLFEHRNPFPRPALPALKENL
jgi:hypothetical protein